MNEEERAHVDPYDLVKVLDHINSANSILEALELIADEGSDLAYRIKSAIAKLSEAHEFIWFAEVDEQEDEKNES
jgi:hypothetical protein